MDHRRKERRSRRQALWTFSCSAIASTLLLSVSKIPWAGFAEAPRNICFDPGRQQPAFQLDLLCGLSYSLPIGDIATRVQMGILLGILALAGTSSYLIWTVLRGTGRSISTIASSTCTSFILLAWVESQSREHALISLWFSWLALLAITLWISPIVRNNRIHFAYALPAWLIAALTIFLDVDGAFFLLGSLALGHCLHWIAAIHRSKEGFAPRQTLASSTRIHIVVIVATVEILFCWLWIGPQPQVLFSPSSNFNNALASIHYIGRLIPEQVLFPAIAFVLLLVIPLRWRGSWLLALTFFGHFTIRSSSSLPGFPATIAAVVCAACGWIWMTARIGPAHWTNQALAIGGAGAIASLLGMPGQEGKNTWWLEQPLSHQRCQHSIQRQVVRSLAAPGDVTLLHEPNLISELRYLQAIEGARPDVIVAEANRLDDPTLSKLAMKWAGENRRILSDSFTLGGRWRAAWATDAGPLFWFLFSAATPTVDELFNFPDRPTTNRNCRYGGNSSEATRWIQMNLERSRFRRAIGLDVSAISALPLASPRREMLRTALQSAQALRVSTDRSSELDLNTASFARVRWSSPEVPAIAEAGDLLFSNGDHQLGSQLLEEAAQAGFQPAWQALVRWQRRAGLDDAAKSAAKELVQNEELHKQSIGLFAWFVHLDRLEDALEFSRGLPEQSIDPARETGIRLQLLRSFAQSRIVPNKPTLANQTHSSTHTNHKK